MKLYTLEAFDAHIQEAYSGFFSQVYAIVAQHEDDRSYFLNRLQKSFLAISKESEVIRLFGAELTAASFLSALHTPSLFSPDTLIVLDEFDLVSRTTLQALSDSMQKLPSEVRLIMSAKNAKNLDQVLEKCRHKQIVLDLTKEKPWDRKSRLMNQLIFAAQKEGMTVAHEALEELFTRIGADCNALLRELNKLMLFCFDSKRIDTQSVKKLVSFSAPLKTFKMSQSWVFDQPALLDEDVSAGDFFMWLGQIRYHLHRGLKAADLLEHNEPIESYFKNLMPKELNRLANSAEQLSSFYFREGLEFCLESEINAKSGSINERLLLQTLIGKLDYARKTYTFA